MTGFRGRIDAALEENLKDTSGMVGFASQVRLVEAAYTKAFKSEVRKAMQAVSRTTGPHEDSLWEGAALWTLDVHWQDPEFVVPYLSAFGYESESMDQWINQTVAGPQIRLELDATATSPAHEEHCGHTWYYINCHLNGIPHRSRGSGCRYYGEASMVLHVSQSSCSWRAPRRLTQLRECLHDPIKAALGNAYTGHFGETPFAKYGGLKGTTARLGAWLSKLAELINNGTMPPVLVALTLVFLRGPPKGVGPEDESLRDSPEEPAAAAAAAAARSDAPEDKRLRFPEEDDLRDSPEEPAAAAAAAAAARSDAPEDKRLRFPEEELTPAAASQLEEVVGPDCTTIADSASQASDEVGDWGMEAAVADGSAEGGALVGKVLATLALPPRAPREPGLEEDQASDPGDPDDDGL